MCHHHTTAVYCIRLLTVPSPYPDLCQLLSLRALNVALTVALESYSFHTCDFDTELDSDWLCDSVISASRGPHQAVGIEQSKAAV